MKFSLLASRISMSRRGPWGGGLSYKFAYVRGDRAGTEREVSNQVKYVVQAGPAKDLFLRLRNSIYRSRNDVGPDLNEIRAFVGYPLSIL